MQEEELQAQAQEVSSRSQVAAATAAAAAAAAAPSHRHTFARSPALIIRSFRREERRQQTLHFSAAASGSRKEEEEEKKRRRRSCFSLSLTAAGVGDRSQEERKEIAGCYCGATIEVRRGAQVNLAEHFAVQRNISIVLQSLVAKSLVLLSPRRSALLSPRLTISRVTSSPSVAAAGLTP